MPLSHTKQTLGSPVAQTRKSSTAIVPKETPPLDTLKQPTLTPLHMAQEFHRFLLLTHQWAGLCRELQV